MMEIKKLLLDLIYPEPARCLKCGVKLSLPEIPGLCFDCLASINYLENLTDSDYCAICGRVVETGQNSGQICSQCASRPPHYDLCRSIGIYRGVLRDLILSYKYLGEKSLAQPLGSLLVRYYNLFFADKEIDYLVPIPLHPQRKEVRGYNQARLLAQVMADKLAIPLLDDLLVRRLETPPLYDLDRDQRQTILDGVFDLNQSKLVSRSVARDQSSSKVKQDRDNPSVLLVDDIFTTGSTVDEATIVLKEEADFAQVYVYTLATAVLE